MPPAPEEPFDQETPWRSALGLRVLSAVVGQVEEKDCQGMELFGDSTWCLSAMKQPGVLGLSYGIEERDMWSEKMSNVFKMPTQLYDCFIPPRQSPPIAGTAPNATQSCQSHPGHCYETQYQAHRICLGPEQKTINGRRYETLAMHLRGRRRLSTHVKIDSEGTEWAVLEQLLASPEDQDKIRTLEMEVHFSFVPEGDSDEAKQMKEQELLEYRAGLMERLLDKFAVTGTNLEVYRQDWRPEEMCPRKSCQEPALHLPRGLSMDQFAISYMHRDLLPPSQRKLAAQ